MSHELAEKLFLASGPEKRKSPYTWLGKRVYALTEIADGIVSFFTPKNTYGHLSMDFCCWSATTSMERKIAAKVET